ncbi:SGNH/GDSL hydrolase family protein [[Mycoplasma] cavipharyngis]|uniref:SGNH/GDSL hydrolase family protein n=1 Tax=[Mycoplasma] cavipharyngis TaxID=92757 RepID=UPI003703D156
MFVATIGLTGSIVLSACSRLPTKSTNRQQAVNYVAIGDSIAAGYNADLGGIDASGEYNNLKNVNGWSYPAFLAHYINSNDSLVLNDFTNLAVSGSQITDWLYFLGQPNSDYQVSQRIQYFQQVKQNNQLEHNPYKNRLENYFKNFAASDFDQVINKIKNANLITISLGGNALLSVLSSNQFLNFITPESSISFFLNIATNYQKLINRIKAINPNAEIVLTDYPKPLLRISETIEQAFSHGLFKFSLDDLLNQLNVNTIGQIAKTNNVNWVHVYDQANWNNHAREYAHNLFDIHPTMIGHKKIAQDIFLKLSLTPKNTPEATVSEWHKLNPLWDLQYLKTDAHQHKQLFKLNLSDQNLVHEIAGTKGNETVFRKSTLENDASLNKILSQNQTGKSFLALLKSSGISFYQLYLSKWLGVMANDSFNTFISANNNYQKLVSWLANNPKFTDNLVFNLTTNLDQVGTKKLSQSDLVNNFNFIVADQINNSSMINLIQAGQDLVNNNYFQDLKNNSNSSTSTTTSTKDNQSNQIHNQVAQKFLEFFEPNQFFNNYLLKNIKKDLVSFFENLLRFLLSNVNNWTNETYQKLFDAIKELNNSKPTQVLNNNQDFDTKLKTWIKDFAAILFDSNLKTVRPSPANNQIKNNNGLDDLGYQKNEFNYLVENWSFDNVKILATLLNVTLVDRNQANATDSTAKK